MSEDKKITMEVITFVKYKDECYEIGEVIKNLLNKIDESNKGLERLKEEKESWKRVATKNFNEAEDYKSIIKEVREKIDNTTINCEGVAEDLIDDIYEILDKENKQ